MNMTWITAVIVAGALIAVPGLPVDAKTRSNQFDMQNDRGGQRSSEWEKITGTIKKTKTVELRGRDQDNLVVQLQTKQGRKKIVDLGNAEQLEDLDIQKGDQITAWGRTVDIGNKQVFMAHKIRANDETVKVERQAMSTGHPRYESSSGERLDFGMSQDRGGRQSPDRY